MEKYDAFPFDESEIIDKAFHVAEWFVEHAVSGFGPFDSAEKLAKEWVDKTGDYEEAIEAMFRSELLKVGVSGFVFSLPGGLLLPLVLPANLSADYFLAARLAAAIAWTRGWDLSEPSVKRFVVLCLIGAKGKDLVKGVARSTGMRVSRDTIGHLSSLLLRLLKSRVGISVLTRFGERTASVVTKSVPILGGLVGAGLDCSFLYVVKRGACEHFSPVFDDEAVDLRKQGSSSSGSESSKTNDKVTQKGSPGSVQNGAKKEKASVGRGFSKRRKRV